MENVSPQNMIGKTRLKTISSPPEIEEMRLLYEVCLNETKDPERHPKTPELDLRPLIVIEDNHHHPTITWVVTVCPLQEGYRLRKGKGVPLGVSALRW